MDSETATKSNVKQAVPFFEVSDMEKSLNFYVNGLGFKMVNKWIDDGKVRWCWLQLDAAAIMLQEFKSRGHDSRVPEGQVGIGVALYFICEDAVAIWREARSRSLTPKMPFVGNGMWVTEIADPDGYKLFFESPTKEPEDTIFRE
jgi:catechol 2,3-dioxygenase-like lactoylglutathione lyase family enzyme